MLISENYKLDKEIGSGTFGKVYLGEHIPTKNPIAIKILDKSKIKDKSDFERVCRELKISQTILHPHLVQLYDMLETDGYIFLIMEYLKGGELYDYIVSKKRLSEQETFSYFVQILSALEYMHKLNIVHRDLKPENLLLDKNKKCIKLVDFGLGRFYNINSKVETACGSPCYAPPEMLSKFKYEPIKADIWSLGIVLYAMLAGFLPFDDENTDNLYKKIIEGRFVIPNWVSDDGKDILSRIINKDPEKRLTIKEIKKHAWFVKHLEIMKNEDKMVCCFKKNHESFKKIDFDVVEILKKKGFKEKVVIEHIKNKNYSDIYCYYHILRNEKRDKYSENNNNKEFKEIKKEVKKEIKRDFKKNNNNKILKEQNSKNNFKKYSGPIDLDFLSIKSPEIIFNELKDKIKNNHIQKLSDDKNGIIHFNSKYYDISFSIRVVQYVDFENGSYIIFEKLKPSKDKFDLFYHKVLNKYLSEIFI